MNGPCLCGDYMCPSCGPAQGYDPRYEALYDKVSEELPKFLETIASYTSGKFTESHIADLVETVTTRISTMLAAQELDSERRFYEQLKEDERLANG